MTKHIRWDVDLFSGEEDGICFVVPEARSTVLLLLAYFSDSKLPFKSISFPSPTRDCTECWCDWMAAVVYSAGLGDYNVSITRYLAQVSAPIYSRGQNWNCQVLILGHSTSGGSIKELSRGDRWRREEGGREGVTHIHKNYPLNLDKSPSLVLISD